MWPRLLTNLSSRAGDKSLPSRQSNFSNLALVPPSPSDSLQSYSTEFSFQNTSGSCYNMAAEERVYANFGPDQEIMEGSASPVYANFPTVHGSSFLEEIGMDSPSPTVTPGCLPHCSCASSPSPTTPSPTKKADPTSSKENRRFKFPAMFTTKIDRSRVITYKRPQERSPTVLEENLCDKCTCFLDPVELNTSRNENAAYVNVVCDDSSSSDDNIRTITGKNRLNLTIQAVNSKDKGGLSSFEPIYARISESPVMEKHGHSNFEYADERSRLPSRPRTLCAIGCMLLLAVAIVLIVINSLVPRMLNKKAHVVGLVETVRIQNLSDILVADWSKHSIAEYTDLEAKTQNRLPNAQDVLLITASPHSKSHRLPAVSLRVNAVENTTLKTTVSSRTNTSIKTTITTTTTAITTTTPATTTTKVTWMPTFDPNIICGPNQFKCPTGSYSRVPCLYKWQRCDGLPDCSDGSDEEFCDQLRCYGNFRCDSGHCISLANVCNGLPDCADKSDELVCDTFQCHPYEYRCNSGYCIPKEWVCDGEMDCPDHQDEYNCSKKCSADQFMCPEGWCIPAAWQCNGVTDCTGGEDERHCSCTPDELDCNGGGCVAPDARCDGVRHCADGSDEWNCVNNDGFLKMLDVGSSQYLPICADDWSNYSSDILCRQLGARRAISTANESIRRQAKKIFSLKSQLLEIESSANLNLQFLVEKRSADECVSRKYVSVECEQYQCGVWHPSENTPHRVKRLIGGHISAKHQWPSIAVLYHPGKAWACTASIISPYYVLTSALCVKRTDRSPYLWRLISGSAQPNVTDPNTMVRTIEEFIPHPNYKFRSLLADYDVMLVRLQRPLDLIGTEPIRDGFKGRVGGVCLPETSTPEGAYCVTAGWGYTSPGGFQMNKQLRHLDMIIGSSNECNGSDHYRGRLKQGMICAANQDPQKGPCFNDEGAPLLCHSTRSASWYLAGMLTHHSCGSRNHPAVFSDVYHMKEWISKTVGFA